MLRTDVGRSPALQNSELDTQAVEIRRVSAKKSPAALVHFVQTLYGRPFKAEASWPRLPPNTELSHRMPHATRRAHSRRLCSCNAFVVVLSAPVSTGVALLSLAVLLLDQVHHGELTTALAIYPVRYLHSLPWDAYRLFTWPLVHRNFSHAWGNLATLLLLGPPLEDRLGSWRLAAILAVTAAATGCLHAALFSNGLIGASGLVMCLLLLSASHAARYSPASGVYELPLSFLVLSVTYVVREVAAMGQDDGISRLAHLLGVACGVLFALRFAAVAPQAASVESNDDHDVASAELEEEGPDECSGSGSPPSQAADGVTGSRHQHHASQGASPRHGAGASAAGVGRLGTELRAASERPAGVSAGDSEWWQEQPRLPPAVDSSRGGAASAGELGGLGLRGLHKRSPVQDSAAGVATGRSSGKALAAAAAAGASLASGRRTGDRPAPHTPPPPADNGFF